MKIQAIKKELSKVFGSPTAFEIKDCLDELGGLTNAIKRGRGAYFLTNPKGNHFNLYYIDKKTGKAQCFWCYEAMKELFYCRENGINSSLKKWTFYSCVYGMDRVLDATEGLSRFLKKYCGVRVQFTWGDVL